MSKSSKTSKTSLLIRRFHPLAVAIGLLGACSTAPRQPPETSAAVAPASKPADKAARPMFQATDLGLLEFDDRDRWQRVEEILDDLNISDGSIVADIAAGGGWFSDRLARRVGPAGTVYAEEIQPAMIEAMKRRIQVENITNITPVLGTPVDPHLPAGRLDAILIVNAFRDIDAPVPLLQNLLRALNRRGHIGVIDFTPGGGGPGPAAEERVAPEAIIAAAEAAHLHLQAKYPLPPFEYLLVFGK
jgi:ubiquinone/menaquinone biosynthesis C-methylase UbiE